MLAAVLRKVRIAAREEARALLFPRSCFACDRPFHRDGWPTGLCPVCIAQLPWRAPGADPRSAPLEVGHRHFAAVVVAFRYAAPVDELVLRLKYGGRAVAARPLAESLAHAFTHAGAIERPQWLVPVPMHPLKRWVRGYDHAAELAEELGAALGLPVRSALRRRRPTVAQGGAGSLRQRMAQVHGAFAAVGRACHGAHLGLVDDVVTSGATAAAAARALRIAGARAVTLLAVAGNG